jgi:hypothetical protein
MGLINHFRQFPGLLATSNLNLFPGFGPNRPETEAISEQ